MDLDNFIIGKTKKRRGEGRFGKTYGVRQFYHRQKRIEEVRVCQKKRHLLVAKKNRAAAAKHRSSRQKTRSSSREVVGKTEVEVVDSSSRKVGGTEKY